MLARWNRRARVFALLSVGLAGGACTSMLGIDGEYVSEVRESPDAGKGATTSLGTGGEGGAASESGGTAGTGPGGSATATCTPSCTGGKKCCPGAPGVAPLCAAREPSVGCSLNTCDPCPDVPPNSTAVCTAGLCDFKCGDKFERVGAVCQAVATGTGGTPGTGGTTGQAGAGTGGAPPCVPTKCPGLGGPMPGCSLASPTGCCRKDGTCGCTYVGMAYCL